MRRNPRKQHSPQFLLLCSLIQLVVCVTPVPAEIRGDVAILKVIADGFESNWEKVRTWKGKVSVRARSTPIAELGRGERNWVHEGDFLIDRDTQATRWHASTIGGTEQKDGIKPTRSSGMIKGDFEYRVTFPEKQELKRSLFITQEGRLPRNIESETFDPMHILFEEVYPELAEQLRFYYDKADSPKMNVDVKRSGDIVTLETRSKHDGVGYLVNRLVFDLSKGCALLEFVSTCDLTKQYWKLDYERVGNVFVMSKVSSLYEDHRSGSERTSQREATLSTEMVNEPVDPNEFGLDRLGLLPGDMVYDQVAGGISYVWKEDFGTKALGTVLMDATIVSRETNLVSPGLQGNVSPNDREATDAKERPKAEPRPIQAPAASHRELRTAVLVWTAAIMGVIVAVVGYALAKKRAK